MSTRTHQSHDPALFTRLLRTFPLSTIADCEPSLSNIIWRDSRVVINHSHVPAGTHEHPQIDTRESMPHPWATSAHRQLWMPMSTVYGVHNIPRQPTEQNMDCPFQEPARLTMTRGWGTDIMRWTVSKIHAATHHDPPVEEKVQHNTGQITVV